jgi:hypothetical protein
LAIWHQSFVAVARLNIYQIVAVTHAHNLRMGRVDRGPIHLRSPLYLLLLLLLLLLRLLLLLLLRSSMILLAH